MTVGVPSELEELLRPLERFEEIRREAVFLGDRLCDLSYANPYGGVSPAARDVLREALASDRSLDLQYSPYGGKTLVRRAVADRLSGTHGGGFRFRDVVLTPGAMAALHLALRTVGSPGEEVVVPVPCWLEYPLYARHRGLRPVPVPLAGEGMRLDPEAVAGAVTSRTCAVLLSHPWNPTGVCHDADDWRRLAAALEEREREVGREITLISDETHRRFVPEEAFASPASAWPRTLLVYSFGKYHRMQGQRAGYVAVSPRHPDREEAREELVRWARVTGAATPTALMQLAVPRLLELEHDLSRTDRWRSRYREGLEAAGYRVVPSAGTFFLYVGVPGGRDDYGFVRSLARAGVLVLPAPVFHHRGHVRLSLTGTDAMLARGLEVLCGAAPEGAAASAGAGAR